MANATMVKFGFPDNLIKEYDHWCILLRPAQVTLGSLVMACKDTAENFSDISLQAFSEMSLVIADIESTLKEFCQYSKINYLMLMMVDKDVHFHVIPRYEIPREYDGQSYSDAGWPLTPDLKAVTTPNNPEDLVSKLRYLWPN